MLTTWKSKAPSQLKSDSKYNKEVIQNDDQTVIGQSSYQDARSRRNNKGRYNSYKCRTGKAQVAEVVAVGPGKTVDGKLVPVQLKVGDKVLMSKYSGTEVKVDGEEYTILREEDILAVVE